MASVGERVRPFRAEHAHGSGEAISGEDIGCDDGDKAVVGEAKSGVRIDDVGITDAIDFYELIEIAGVRDAAIVKEQKSLAALRIRGFEQLNFPTFLAGRWIAERHVAAGCDKSALTAVLTENAEGFVRGVPFGNGAWRSRIGRH